MLDQIVQQWIRNGDETVDRIVEDFKFIDLAHKFYILANKDKQYRQLSYSLASEKA